MEPEKWIEGIAIPPLDVWTALPGTDVQVIMASQDMIGTVRYRYRPKVHQPIGDHLILCEDKTCPGCM